MQTGVRTGINTGIKTVMKFKRRIKNAMMLVSLISALSLVLGGCSKYDSHYFAIGYVSSNGYMSFSEFDGVQAHSFDWDKDTPGHVRYTAKLGKGSATVYYDMDGTKKPWFSVKEGDSMEGTDLEIPKGSIDILVETDGSCKDGEFRFEVVD